ncbi:MAG: hypothetical protein E7620_01365 [Ruminococcaceae bacterium]|nr:hypothetical protein [Oscillospiraceae bacterium]
MYEYAPKLKKTREKTSVGLSIMLGALSFGCSRLSIPLPWIYQLIAVACFGFSILVGGRYLLRDYIYRVVPNHGGVSPDLTVTECYGRRRTVVCRIALHEIAACQAVTAENRKSLAKACRGEACYPYVSERYPENEYLLTVEDGEKRYFVRICADQALVDLLTNYKEQ